VELFILTSVKYDIAKAPAGLPTAVVCRCIVVVFCIINRLMCVLCLVVCPVKFRAISSVAFFNFPFRRHVYVNVFRYSAVFHSCLFPTYGVVFHGTTFLIG